MKKELKRKARPPGRAKKGKTAGPGGSFREENPK